LAILAVHYFEHELFQAQQDQPKEVPGKKGPARVVPAKPRDTTFLEYLDERARKGIPVHFRRIHFNLGYVGTYIYWVVEVLIVSVLVVAIMRGSPADPFC